MGEPAHKAWYKTYRWQKLRERHLAKNPICVMCMEEGRPEIAKVCDHVNQHHGDPVSFWQGPFQSLCKFHHDSTKQHLERNELAASNHPEWLPKSAIPLTIVSGPPASGKTTYIQEHASPNDVVIDLDGIMQRLSPGYAHWTNGLDKGLFNRAIRERNNMLANLSRTNKGKAWFIVSSPTHAERQWWLNKLGGELVLLNPGITECKRRAIARGTP